MRMSKSILVVVLMAMLLPFTSAHAVGNLKNAAGNLVPAKTAAGYEEGDLGNITGQIIYTALQLVGIIFLALMVYAGYLWMTAQGEESQIEKAKKIVTSAIIGLILTLSAYAITALVTSRFSSGGNNNPDPDAPALKAAGARCLNGNECQSGICMGNVGAEVCAP